jgi:methanogen extracellular protein (TIGR04279 family)/PGF-pre-PGF domain-containing protein
VGGIHLKKSHLIVALALFFLTSAAAIAPNSCDIGGNVTPNGSNVTPNGSNVTPNGSNVTPDGINVTPGGSNVIFGSINFTDKVVYVLDHTSDPSEGNWITMKSPHEGGRVQLPQPITITYSGPIFEKYGSVSGNLYPNNNRNYTINYPSTSSYTSLPVYLPGEKVNMSFFGDSSLGGNVEIYLFNVTSNSTYGILEAFNTGNIGNLESLFHKNMDGNYKKYSAVLGTNGDLLDYDLGSFGAGQYFIVMVQKNEDNSLKVLSTTALMVAESDLKVTAPESIEEGKDLDISMSLKGAPNNSNDTYGAILVNKQAYKANIEINSNGTKNGTSVFVNGANFIDKFDINSSNYRSKLTTTELQKEIITLVGEGEGSIAIGENGQNKLSLTAFDLPQGQYYLFVGAYGPKKELAGLTQLEVEIKSKSIPPLPPTPITPTPEPTPEPTPITPTNNVSINSGGSGNGGSGSGSGSGSSSGSGSGSSSGSGSGSSSGSSSGSGSGSSSGSSSGSGSGSSSGSGNGGSHESAKNIKLQELCQQFILNGNMVRFDFTKGPIVYVEFKPKKTFGKTTTIVEELIGKSILTSNEPEGSIYKHVNIWVGNGGFANAENIENATVCFKVSKGWIDENHIKIDSLILQHFSDKKWNSLSTEKVSEDTNYIYLIAKTPSFSPFAISAEKDVTVIEEKGKENQEPSKLTYEDKKGSTTGTDNASLENKNQGILKVAIFFSGLLIVLILGAIIMKKKGPEK